MDRYIGIDVHSASSTVAVMDSAGKRLRTTVVETNGQALVECLKLIPGERHVCIEEGTQSTWLYEILAPHVARMVVTRIADSRGPKSDERDAVGLANQLRLGAITSPVFKDAGAFRTLREMARTYAMVVQDSVRVQSRIKSIYRSRGIATAGRAVYSAKTRAAWLEQLPEAQREAATTLYAAYDALAGVRDDAEKRLVRASRQHAVARLLETCPGLGPIRTAQLIPIVVTPHRFRTKRQFWTYCGLGIVMRSSSDWRRDPAQGTWRREGVTQTRGLNQNHNHTLKAIFKGAATTVILQHPDDPLHASYRRHLDAGIKPNLAKVTLARKIAAIALSMWKHQKEYAPTQATDDTTSANTGAEDTR